MFTLTSLNLNGIRSAATKGLQEWMAQSLPDCICVQELKAQAADLSGRFEEMAGHKGYFHFAEKKGYSGVGIYTRHEPTDVIVGYGSTEFDAEGRYVELRFDRPGRAHSPKLSVISCYFPSGSSGEERQAAKFRFLAELYPRLMALKQCGGTPREFVLCGDINIAHQEIDLKNFKGNRKNSGFLPEERAWMTGLLAPTLPTACGSLPPEGSAAPAAGQSPFRGPGLLGTAPTLCTADDSPQPGGASVLALNSPAQGGGMVDVYRRLHPETTGEAYTWWSNRGQAYAKNVGWRLDYQLATPNLAATARTAAVYKDVKFSDHAPLTVDYDCDL
ncbi:MAG: exodeoxyribonuclease Xth [Polaromonas sp.]|jgi:exodeoxyribonuclease-3|nr:exodeoxyribonuclease Xth [Polaromonas sp.]